MIKENRVSKYLLYAIGEIVLVVIGILIALQINNWNQERIAHQEECKILQSLLDDLYLNDYTLEECREVIERQVVYTKSLLMMMSEEPEQTAVFGRLDSLILKGTEVPLLQLRMGALNGVIANKLGLISNDSIQQMIMAYPVALSQHKAHEKIMRSLTDNRIRPRIKDFLYLRSIVNKSETFPSDRMGLLSDRMFANHLQDRIWESAEWRQNLTDLQTAGQNLIQAIESNLNTHCNEKIND